MNAPETITEAINQAHDTLAHYDEAMSADQIAYELAGRIKPTKAHTKEAVKQLKQLADLGMIEMEPRAGGVPFYRLIAAPVAESSGVVIPPPPEHDPASVAFAASEPTDSMGIPISCGKPLCAPGDHHPLCKLSWTKAGDSEGGEAGTPITDAQRDEFTLLGLIADIRAAAGDPTGKLMQDELVRHIAAVVKERDDLRERLDAQITQWQTDTGRLAADLRAAMEARSQAINEADRLRTELTIERQARKALQEQGNATDVTAAAVGYLVRVPKRPPMIRRKPEAARLAALGAVRAGAARADVLAIVPVGAARRGAEWREA